MLDSVQLVKIKKGLFKKSVIEISERLLSQCKGLKEKEVYVADKGDFMVVTTSHSKAVDIAYEIDEILKERKNPPYTKMQFVRDNDGSTTYHDVVGFYEYRGRIFYRVKGNSGKDVKTGDSMLDVVRLNNPKVTIKDLGSIIVIPLQVSMIK